MLELLEEDDGRKFHDMGDFDEDHEEEKDADVETAILEGD